MKILNTRHGSFVYRKSPKTIRCPKCARPIPQKFIMEAYELIGKRHTQEFYHKLKIELGLRGMAKRWNKPYERLLKRYNKRHLKLDTANTGRRE